MTVSIFVYILHQCMLISSYFLVKYRWPLFSIATMPTPGTALTHNLLPLRLLYKVCYMGLALMIFCSVHWLASPGASAMFHAWSSWMIRLRSRDSSREFGPGRYSTIRRPLLVSCAAQGGLNLLRVHALSLEYWWNPGVEIVTADGALKLVHVYLQVYKYQMNLHTHQPCHVFCF